MMGGSNMAGRARLPGRDAGYTENAYMLDARGRWQNAQEPVNPHDGQAEGAGPQLAFARRLLELLPETAGVFLIPCAVGGCKMDDWVQGGALFDAAVKRAKLGAEACDGVICGMVWHQGEVDAERSENDARLVGGKLVAMVHAMRQVLGTFDLPFISAHIGPFLKGGAGKNAWLVNGGLDALAGQKRDLNTWKRTKTETVIRARCCTMEQTTSDDSLHFDLKTMQLLGRRYADAWFTMEGHNFPDESKLKGLAWGPGS